MKDIEYKIKQHKIKIKSIRSSDGDIYFNIYDNNVFMVGDRMLKNNLQQWKDTLDIKVWCFWWITDKLITPKAIDMMIKEMWGEE